MSLVYINGNDLVRSIKAGSIKLEHNRDRVDLLNVFPVPDGDTGTNMYLTLLSAVKEGEKNFDKPLGKVAKAISMGSLMGARGNSGVILSQIFRGIAKEFEGKEQADALTLAMALKSGSDTAYEAVMKPVEGTILTVIREIAACCEKEARNGNDILGTLVAGVQTGYETLKKTPNMLPILKEAGVVDAGGQGLIFFLEGMIEGLAHQKEIPLEVYRDKIAKKDKQKNFEEPLELDFQYCTEVLVKGEELNVQDMKDHLAPLGDSMLVVGGDDLVKVHIHSNHPGKVLETCLQWGSLTDIKINNMLDEVHEHLNNWEEQETEVSIKKIGLVAVGVGEGVIGILQSLGVDIVVEGGQTMNPSTEDLLNACNSINAESIIILPNNGNIIMAARQVVDLCDRKVKVIPTKSVMQSITALISYDPEGDLDIVFNAMSEEIESIKYAEVTYAVRDSSVNGIEIKEGDNIGIIEGKIALTSNSAGEALAKVLQQMVDEDSELITFFYGEEVTEDEAMADKEKITENYPDCEVECHYGGQPHYSYFISVE